MNLALLFGWAVVVAACGLPSTTVIRNLHLRGNLRVRPEAVVRLMSSAPGTSLNEARISDDIRRLHELRVFRSIVIRSVPVAMGEVDLLVEVRERPFVSSFSIEGASEGLESRVRSLLRERKIEFPTASPYDPVRAALAARLVRSLLADRGHPLAEVEVLTEDRGSLVGIRLAMRTGPKLKVGGIALSGNQSIPAKRLLGQMRHTRPARWWEIWSGAGCYAPEKLAADLEQVRQYYRSHGYADVRLGAPGIVATGVSRPRWPLPRLGMDRPGLLIDVPVIEGNRYALRSVEVEGDAGFADGAIRSIAGGLRSASNYDGTLLRATRQKMLDALGHEGYASGSVELSESIDKERRLVHARFKVDPGRTFFIGKIRFSGNERLPDRMLRRELRLAEGRVFDSALLGDSVERLNRTGLIEPMKRENVAVQTDPSAGGADVIFNVREKPVRSIYATGGTGGAAGGYLGVIYTAFNLLGLGEKLALELDGGASQSNLLLDLVGRHFLGSQFTIGLSLFHRFSGVNVAGIVPDGTDLVNVFRERRTGLQLSGSYSLTRRLEAGIGLLAERRTVVSGETGEAQAAPGGQISSEIASTIHLNSTTGSGSGTRGFHLLLGNTISQGSFFRSPETVSAAMGISSYLADPVTRRRNSFVFALRVSGVHPLGERQLAPERRMYPGGEVLRGFPRGGLGSWALSTENGAPNLKPAGSDTLVAVSGEYRIHIAGPLSGAAFFDLGWTGLDPANEPPGAGTQRLLEVTSGLLRASVGGEVRFDLPVIRQPGRLIFAWNPLRLDRLLQAGETTRRLADPRGMVRFALGGVY